MDKRTKALVAAPVCLYISVNLLRWWKSARLLAKLVDTLGAESVDDADRLLDSVWTAVSDFDRVEENNTMGADCQKITMHLHRPWLDPDEVCVSLDLKQLAAEDYDLASIYAVYCALDHVLVARLRMAATHCHGSIDLVDAQLLHIDTWNVFCAAANVTLCLDGDHATADVRVLATTVAMCELALSQYNVTRHYGNAAPAGCVVIEAIDKGRLDAARKAVKANASPLASSVMFVRTLRRVCSVWQIASVVALSLLGNSVFSFLTTPFTYNSSLSFTEVAQRQSTAALGSSFAAFCRSVLLGYPGKLMATGLLATTVSRLLTVAKESLTERVFASFSASITSEVIMAAMRYDYVQWCSLDLGTVGWHMSIATDSRFLGLDVLFELLVRHIRASATFLVFPVEVAVGWLAVQFESYTFTQLTRLSGLMAYTDQVLARKPPAPRRPAAASRPLLRWAQARLAGRGSDKDSDGQQPLAQEDSSALATWTPQARAETALDGAWLLQGAARPTYGLLTLLLAAATSEKEPPTVHQAAACIIQCPALVRLLHIIRIPFTPMAILPCADFLCQVAVDLSCMAPPHLSLDAARYFSSKRARLHLAAEQLDCDDDDENRGAVPPRAELCVRGMYKVIADYDISEVRVGGWGDGVSGLVQESGATGGAAAAAALPSGTGLWLGVPSFLLSLHDFACGILMIASSTLYSSQMEHLSAVEADRLPEELDSVSRLYPLLSQRWTMGRTPDHMRGGGSAPPALCDVQVYTAGRGSEYPIAVDNLSHLCAKRQIIDTLPWGECASLPRGAWSIEFRDVSFQYRGNSTFTLRDISFRVDAGRFLGIIGFSGVGKTTLLLLLSRIFAPASGVILLNDTPIDRFCPRELRRRIFNAWQSDSDMRFLAELSIEGNIALGNLLDASDQRIRGALKAADAWEFVESRGRGRKGQMHTAELSGGEIERLNIARGLMKDAESTGLFLFDECTSAMDSLTENKIMTRIGGAWRPNSSHEVAQTRIMISHRLSSIRSADEIIVLANGRIAERGTWRKLHSGKANLNFHKLLAAQAVASDVQENVIQVQV